MKNYPFTTLASAGVKFIVCNTVEETRAIEEAWRAGKVSSKETWVYSITEGLRVLKELKFDENANREKFDSEDIVDYVWGKTIFSKDECMPLDIFCAVRPEIDKSEKNKKPVILVVKYFKDMLDNMVIVRGIKDLIFYNESITIILIGENIEVPYELKNLAFTVDIELPSDELLKKMINNTVESLKSDGHKIKCSKKKIELAAQKLVGLTLMQAQDAIAISLQEKKCLDIQMIIDTKKHILAEEHPAITYYEPTNDEIGGFGNYKRFLCEVRACLTPEAQKENIPMPKGVLLMGVPGCGKSLAAKITATSLNIPLLRFDLSSLRAKYVGETEKNMKAVLRLAERLYPCVLWPDEVEKGLAGSSGGDETGVSTRMLGTLLTWMQENKKPVFIVATANEIEKLPEELLRKGRFDKIFFVDLPTEDERKQIFKIHVKKYEGENVVAEISDEEYDELAKKTEGFSGAEIEDIVKNAKVSAFMEKRKYTAEDIMQLIETNAPTADGIMRRKVNNLREWAKNNGIPNVS